MHFGVASMARTSPQASPVLLLQLLWVLLLQRCCLSRAMEEDCVWIGRDEKRQPGIQSVVTVKASCNEGQIQWPRPHGGLRIAFSPRNIHESSFQVCFSARFHGINIYKEGARNLTLLKSAKSEKVDDKICISSIGQLAVLYLEATPGSPEETAKLHYTVYTMKNKKLHRPKDCKPCDYSKLVQSFCNSDFVACGYIKSMYPLDDGQTAQVDVVVSELIRQEHEIFVKRNDGDTNYVGSMKVPLGCNWKESEKRKFLFTGNIESGKGPVLGCHIHEEIWVKLRKSTILHMCGVFRKK